MVAETPTWAHLAVVGDGILVKDAARLAYDSRPAE
jgi:hypothetical protein